VSDEIEVLEPTAPVGALLQIEKATIDTQIATAKQYPRSITKFLREAEEIACLDEETAASCFYRVPRDGKYIEGPSARIYGAGGLHRPRTQHPQDF